MIDLANPLYGSQIPLTQMAIVRARASVEDL